MQLPQPEGPGPVPEATAAPPSLALVPNGVAQRFDRREFKFVVDRDTAQGVLAVVRCRLNPDRHGDARGGYRIATVYYDNDDWDCYWDRARGLKPRQKLRLRHYGAEVPESGPCFVEIKARLRRRVVKRRLRASPKEARALCAGRRWWRAADPLDELLAKDVERMVAQRRLAPACLLRYRREAYADEASDLRVTVDTGLTYRLEAPDHIEDGRFDGEVLPESQAVLEVKVRDVVPQWLAEALAAGGATMRSFSKYAEAVEASGTLGGVAAAPMERRHVRNPAREAKAWIS
ncbi:MAG: VTC domain-containing protein [Anaerolineae bacterium]